MEMQVVQTTRGDRTPNQAAPDGWRWIEGSEWMWRAGGILNGGGGGAVIGSVVRSYGLAGVARALAAVRIRRRPHDDPGTPGRGMRSAWTQWTRKAWKAEAENADRWVGGDS